MIADNYILVLELLEEQTVGENESQYVESFFPIIAQQYRQTAVQNFIMALPHSLTISMRYSPNFSSLPLLLQTDVSNFSSTCPLLVQTGGGFSVSYAGRNLYSQREPEKRPVELARRTDIPEETLVIVPSPLLGYGLSVLLEKLPLSSRILYIEADQPLMALSLEHISRNLIEDERLSYIRTDSPQRALEFGLQQGLLRFRKTILVPLSGAYSLNAVFYRAVQNLLDSEIQRYWRNRMTLIRMGRLWIRNLFKNLPSLASGKDIAGIKSTKAVVVAGAGESLEESLSWIALERSSIFLIAADTALPVFSSAGIVPDLVLSLKVRSQT